MTQLQTTKDAIESNKNQH